MDKMLEVLLRCPLFAQISAGDMTGLLACLGAREKWADKGEVILAEGSSAEDVGVVISGSVEVMRLDCSGNRSILAHLHQAELFGETFACAGVERMPVHVVALEKTQLVLLQARRIMQPCSQACAFHQQLVYNLMRILAQKNLRFQQKIEIVSCRTTREKLLAYLNIEAQRRGSRKINIPYSRQELADYLEVDRSGLSAVISRLREEGVIRCERNCFELLYGHK